MENRTIYNDYENKMMSVKNNQIFASADDSDDDFDRLLDEFVRSEFEGQAKEKSDKDDSSCLHFDDYYYDEGFPEFQNGYVNFELGGDVYCMPEQPHLCKASRLMLGNGCYEKQQLAGEPVVFAVTDGCSPSLILSAHTLRGLKTGCAPVVYIYKAAKSYPLRREPLVYNSDENSLVLTSENMMKGLSNGNYFFYLWGIEVEGLASLYRSCNGGCCIPFTKVDGDVELPNVALEKVKVSMDASGEFLDISLGFDKAVGNRYGYSLFLYNRNYNLVSRGAAFSWGMFCKHKRKNLTARIKARSALFGEYRLFIVENDTPRWRIGLSVDNGMLVSTDVSEVKRFSTEYLMLKELEKRTGWHSFRESNATLEMKRYFLSSCSRDCLNNKRRSMGIGVIDAVPNFVYNGGYSAWELRELSRMSRMFRNRYYFDSADCVSLTDANNINLNNEVNELFDGCSNKCIAFYNITALVGNGSNVVNRMLVAMANNSSFAVCLIGSPAEVNQLFDCYPQLKKCFPPSNCISTCNMSADTYVAQVVNELLVYDLRLSSDAQRILSDAAKCAESDGCLNGLTMADITEFVKNGIVENFINRSLAALGDGDVEDRDFHTTIEACDIDKDRIVKGREKEFEESIAQLNAMVGLNSVKKNIIRTFNMLKMNAERRRLGLRVKSGEAHHMIFTGNPGTGKTTVAKMMGRIYRSLGLLSKGDVVFVDRGKIVGRYIGETERNMQRILNEAKGNILFVDEAYTLCDSLADRKDFGYRAIECLLTVMAQENCDMIVIFAGYAKEMDMMMRSNQGLSGRFPYRFEFEDYTADELVLIAEQKLEQQDYELTSEARELLHKSIGECVRNKEWGFSNARWIEQYVNNGIIPAQGERLLLSDGAKSRDDYRYVTVDDVSAAYAMYKPEKRSGKVYREIGFTA